MKKITLIISFLLTVMSINAQSSKENLVKQLFSITQTDQMAPALVGTVINNFKKNNTNIPQWYWEDIKKSISYSEFNNKVTNVYISSFTAKELEALIQLYNSKSIEVYKQKSKKVEAQLYQIGSEFGRDVAQKILVKVQSYKG